MAEQMIVRAPAKINLALAVIRRRSDGYHELASVMQQISLCDILVLKTAEAPAGLFRCSDQELENSENLVRQAARKLRLRATSQLPGVEMKLFKAVPRDAGLGGGSSDAAAALTALNNFWGLRLFKKELLEIGAALGSDIPFCLHGGTVLARGRGQLLTPLPPLPFFWVVLALPPGLSISTREAYRSLPDPQGLVQPALESLVEAIREGHSAKILAWFSAGYSNTLELAVLPQYPQLHKLIRRMRSLGLHPAMSGSGPALFALSPSYREAAQAASILQHEGNRSYLCWTL